MKFNAKKIVFLIRLTMITIKKMISFPKVLNKLKGKILIMKIMLFINKATYSNKLSSF